MNTERRTRTWNPEPGTWNPSWFCLLALAVCITGLSCSSATAQRSSLVHPLDPLSADEIALATSVLRTGGQLLPSVRFVILELDEPDKARVAEQLAARTVRRVARAVLYDWARGATSEARVDLTTRAIVSTIDRGVGEPPVRHAILSRATEIATADSRVVQALRQRGITQLDRLTFLGGLREGETPARRGSARLITVSPYVWDEIGDLDGVAGLQVQVDLAGGVVVGVNDFPARPAPRSSTAKPNDSPAALKPLRVTQPDGPSFRISGSEIEWDRWRLHFAIHPRRGLEVFDVSLRDGNRYRQVLYRGSLSELITPYGDPGFGSWYPRDEGDYGMTSYSGSRAQAIVGTDAPDNAMFVPASIAGTTGQVITIDRAVAVYERDAGVLWRHAAESRRARQLVLSGYTTVDNYDYLFHWIFSQDGAIDVQVQLTGLLNVRPGSGAHDPASPHFAHLVAPGVEAPNHQHFFSWRLDLDVDGVANRVAELNTSNAQTALRDTVGEWFGMEQRTLRTEREGQRDIDASTARRWLVASATRTNALGAPTAFAIVPGENAPPFQSPTSAPRRRVPFLNHHLWVTRHDRAHMYASGESVNLPALNEGVASWSDDDQSIQDQDVVLWYTFSVVHLPRPEDWPVMPAHTAGFRLVPVGFFVGNPTLMP